MACDKLVLFLPPCTQRQEEDLLLRFDSEISGFFREQADPHLEKGVARLKQIEG